MAKKLNVGILETGITADDLIEEHGSYSDMFINLFSDHGWDFDFKIYAVRNDEFPHEISECDAWIITGSKSNVYDNLPWMLKLKQLIQSISKANQPMVGICFGHQIIAQALGGKVEKYSAGWGVGLHEYHITSPISDINDMPETFVINAMHQDQVVEKPEQAHVFAQSDFCPYAGLIYNDKIFTLQGHPEFSLEFEKALILTRMGNTIPEETAKNGLSLLGKQGAQTDSRLVVNWMAKVLHNI